MKRQKHFLIFLLCGDTHPWGKVLLGFKITGKLYAFLQHRVVAKVSLQGVTRQLEVDLLLLTTFRA